MIRRAAYQEVIVVVDQAVLPPLNSSPPSSSSLAYTQQQQQQQQHPLLFRPPWDASNASSEYKNNFSNKSTFKVPIHLIKRSRAVLVRDLERLVAPAGLQAIQTKRGDIVYNRHENESMSASINNFDATNINLTDKQSSINNSNNSIALDRDAAARSSHRLSNSSPIVAVALPLSSFSHHSAHSYSHNSAIAPSSTTASTLLSSLHQPTSYSQKSEQQQYPMFIPILDDAEDNIWYLFPTTSPSHSPSPYSLSYNCSSSSSSNNIHSISTPITNGKDDHRLVKRRDMSAGCSQPYSSSSSLFSSPLPIATVTVAVVAETEDSKEYSNGQKQQELLLLQERRRYTRQEEEDFEQQDHHYRQEQEVRRMQSLFEKEEGNRTLLSLKLSRAASCSGNDNDDNVDDADDTDKGHDIEQGREEEGMKVRVKEGARSQQTRTKLGGIAAGQSLDSDGSRSRIGSTQASFSASCSNSMSTLMMTTSPINTLFDSTPNNDWPQRYQGVEGKQKQQLQLQWCDKDKEGTLSSSSIAPSSSEPSCPDNHRSEHTSADSSLLIPFSSISLSSLSSLSSFSSSSLSSSSFIPTSAHLPPTAVATTTTTILGSANTPPSSLSTTTNNNQSTAFIFSPTPSLFSGTTFTTTHPKLTMNPSGSTRSQSSSSTQSACTVECWTTMVQLQEQLEQVAHALLSVLDDGRSSSKYGSLLGSLKDERYNDDEEESRRRILRVIAVAALETCAEISSSSPTTTTPKTTYTTLTTLTTPTPSLHSTKGISKDKENEGPIDNTNNSSNQYGLLTPDVTPVSTPVITATIHNHHQQQQPPSPRGSGGLHSVSRTFTGGSASSSNSTTGGGINPSVLTLPGSIVLDLERQQQQRHEEEEGLRPNYRRLSRTNSSGGNEPQLLQDTVSHFSSYRMSFPPLLTSTDSLPSSSTAVHITSTSTSTLSLPTTSTSATSRTMLPSTTPVTTKMGSGKKNKNPFLAIFGKNSNSTTSPMPLSPPQGPFSTSSCSVSSNHAQHLSFSTLSKPNSTKSNSSNVSKSSKKKNGGEGGSEQKRRSSWFKSTAQRGRANTMLAALPSSASGTQTATLDSRRSSKSVSSSATACATIATSRSESSTPRVPPDAIAPGRTTTTRRFSAPFQFNLRGSQKTALPSVNNKTSSQTCPATAPTLLPSSRHRNPSIPPVPQLLQTQTTGSRQGHSQYYYPVNHHRPQQIGPSTTTATGCFFDSVSDDDSDSDESLSDQHYQHQHQYQSQVQAQQPPPQYQPAHARRPLSHPATAVCQYEQDRRYRDYDSSDDSETEEEDDSDDEDEDEEEEDSDEEGERHHHYHRHNRQQQQVSPNTLEGYDQRLEDAPPPPSYHSLIREEANAARSAALATIYSSGAISLTRTGFNNHIRDNPHHLASAMRPSTLLTGLPSPTATSITTASPSPLSVPCSTPVQTLTGHQNTHTVSTDILAHLLHLLHIFESNLLDLHRHPSFHSQEQGRRQAWLDRNPQTVASFAYLLIELQQTGILATAMSPSWSYPSSSPSPHLSEISEQDWLSMTGNAVTEADLAKAMLALEQNCRLGMNPVSWRQQSEEEEGESSAWVRQVQAIITPCDPN